VPDPTKVIVTTRQRIDVAFAVRLVEMPWQDAQALINQECEKKGVLLTVEQARRLYECTGGVPLALVWSIARVALGEEAEHVLRRLARSDSDVARFCFEGVVQPLRARETYKLLVASTLFAQDTPREALGPVAGVEECEDDLVTLERLSLLNRQGGRFSLLPLTRSYLDRELERVPEFAQAAFARLLAYYQQLVRPPAEIMMGDPYWDGALNYDAVSRLRPEWGNIAYALRRALDESRYREALELFLPIVHLMDGWGLWEERLSWSRAMCQAARALNDPCEAWLWIDAIGWVFSQRQQVAECLEALTAGRTAAHRFDLADALTLADVREAVLHFSLGDIDLARHRIETALEQVDWVSALERGSKVHRIIASRVVSMVGWLNWKEHDYAHAKQWYQRELDLRHATGENPAPSLWRLGEVSFKLGDVAAAEKFFVETLDRGKPKDAAWAHYGLGLLAERKGEVQEAQHWAKLALEQFTRLGVTAGLQEIQELVARLPPAGEEEKGA
jgi:tetratricopeptide (TPR) repeat protein